MAHIGVNTLSIIPGRIGGGQTYLQNLLSYLGRIDRHNRYTLFVNDFNCHLFPNSENFHHVRCRVSKNNRLNRLLWEQFVLPWRTFVGKLDVLFCPANLLPLTPLPCRSVLTVHDLTFWHVDVPGADIRLLRLFVASSVRKADKILTVSECTKADIISKFHIAKERIAVVHEAPGELCGNVGAHGLSPGPASVETRKYLLAVGTTHHHKNLLRLLDAYALLKTRQGLGHRLVIAGMPGSGHAQLRDRVALLGLEKDVSVTGHVSQAELLDLYRLCDLFVFPSLFEGFGLPLLEAMSCGVPVVSSKAGSLPEIGGDAALYFDPLDVEEMAGKIAMVLRDDDTRKRLIASGLERVKSFSWEKAARETLSVIESVTASPGDAEHLSVSTTGS